MRRFDYYAGVLILASALFLGQMAARHGSMTSAQAQGEATATTTQAQGGAATGTTQAQGGAATGTTQAQGGAAATATQAQGGAATDTAQGGAAKVPDVISAHELRLVDAKGQVRALLQANDKGTALALITPDGKTMTNLVQLSNGGMILTGADSSDGPNITLASTSGGAVFELAGKNRNDILMNTNGKPDKPTIALRAGEDTTTLPSSP
jgi:hypothetical protein